MTNEKLKQFFTVSNAIEDIDDIGEVESNMELYYAQKTVPTANLITVMHFYHSQLGHLNDHCEAGKIRDYPVTVGGNPCIDHWRIKEKLIELFKQNPTTFDDIKRWHIRFEHIHPFGDGNGRTGRFMMLLQAESIGIEIPEIFFDMENFEENRRKYYQWFK